MGDGAEEWQSETFTVHVCRHAPLPQVGFRGELCRRHAARPDQEPRFCRSGRLPISQKHINRWQFLISILTSSLR